MEAGSIRPARMTAGSAATTAVPAMTRIGMIVMPGSVDFTSYSRLAMKCTVANPMASPAAMPIAAIKDISRVRRFGWLRWDEDGAWRCGRGVAWRRCMRGLYGGASVERGQCDAAV